MSAREPGAWDALRGVLVVVVFLKLIFATEQWHDKHEEANVEKDVAEEGDSDLDPYIHSCMRASIISSIKDTL